MNIFGLVIQTSGSRASELDKLVKAKVKERDEYICQLVSDAQGLTSRAMGAENAAEKHCASILKMQNAIKGKDQAIRLAIKLLRENSALDSQMGRLRVLLMGRVSGTELLPHELGHPLLDDATEMQRARYREAQNHYSEIAGASIETGVADSITGYKCPTIKIGNLS